MVAKLLGLAFLYLMTGPFTFSAHGTSVYPVPTSSININPNWEVVYRDTDVYGVVGKAVILECGTSMPDIYIWSFTKPGTDGIRAVVYNLGKGPRIQQLAETLGQLTIISNSAAVSIEKLPLAAHGLFTCQAFYNVDKEPVVYYYYVHLNVRVPVSKPYLSLSEVSPVEGSTMSMQCNLENGTGPIQYVWQHETHSGNITVVAQGSSNRINMTDVNRNHTGWYRCIATNAVNSESSNRLWLDTIYGPDIPRIDVTPYSITERGYSALERETVSLMCQAPSNPASQYVWFYNNSQVYSGPQYTITKILRMHTGDYACLAQNTYLNTRSKKTISLTVYSEPRNNMYPAVIGAAIGGMLFAAILTILLLMYIIRNRNNNPRLHDLLFGMQHSQSRENINFPEDEMVRGSDGGIEDIGGLSTAGPAVSIPRASSPLTAAPRSATPTPTSQAPSSGDDNEPVSVTITVKAAES
ncbi:putative pregnancy-specific beta-1-glycoprotein 7 [Poecilia latipinna]|uniref:putative pregnancy-specific beta-1-glycoprotein 7 n=1 Tax=Poecilia latipinna TaxID=48699 RepID=UPI00072E845C|nr:PREDICTED: putative pregnancy-specific beta-1-glycoprotein 7 [Poecilia latipinna]